MYGNECLIVPFSQKTWQILSRLDRSKVRSFESRLGEDLTIKKRMSKTTLFNCTVHESILEVTKIEKKVIIFPRS